MTIEERHLTDEELKPYFEALDIPLAKINDNARVAALIMQQTDPEHGYPRLIRNMKTFSQSLSTNLIVDTIPLRLVLNKTRRQSLTSVTFEKTDNLTPPCFLCQLDQGQRGILILDNQFIVLTNPGITLPGDLTIAAKEHQPQLISGRFDYMLQIAELLPSFSIYFNGPLAGASSPHFHFQASYKDKLPGEQQIQQLLAGKNVGNARLRKIIKRNELEVYNVENFLRSTQLVVAKERNRLDDFFAFYLTKLAEISTAIKGLPNIPDFGTLITSLGELETEPRLNIMVKYYPAYQAYIAGFFPKRFNRPQFYFKQSRAQIILGMAIKEALGNLITCRQTDYNRLQKRLDLVRQAYADTTITSAMEMEFLQRLKELS
jgi:hypothetical protein